MRTPQLTEFEKFALRHGTYGGIPTAKLKEARRQAKIKMDLGAKSEPLPRIPNIKA